MSITHSIYTLVSGEITRITTCPDEVVSDIYDPATEGIVAGSFIGTNYYFNGLDAVPKETYPITQNKVSIITDEVDISSITNIPANTSVLLSSPMGQQTHIINDGTIDFSTSQQGIYRLKFTNVKFLEMELTINAN